ncbi:MAG: DegT/DnrJ/EryC1/StrS family aminotransferase [Spirochaetes bacterium]|nr:DegT/DnrJ/EryC1/StrS family aminotransferase [Spirochaetota bacterium]
MKIPFHKPYITDDEIAAVTDTLRSGWTTMGYRTVEFESRMRDYLGVREAVAVNSCTAAIHLGLIAMGVGPEDEVIMPALNFASAAEASCYLGAVPVFADVDPATHLLDLADLERRITEKTRVIVPVHYGGVPCDMEPIMEIARGRGIHVLDDAAHALPAWYRGRIVGGIGDITCFSFYVTKTISAGEGGMAATDNAVWGERIRLLRLHGISRDAWKRYLEGGSWRYDIIEPGYKYNPTDIASALCLAQLSKLEAMREMRARIAEQYDAAFRDIDELDPYRIPEDRVSSWHLYPLRLNTEALSISRDRFIEELSERGIGTSVHYIPLYRFTAYRGMAAGPEDYPGTELAFGRSISLPIYPSMTDNETAYVIQSCIDIIARSRR